MDWEELVEKAKELGYEYIELYDKPLKKFIDGLGEITFYSNGLVRIGNGYDNGYLWKTYEKMYQIMLALED